MSETLRFVLEDAAALAREHEENLRLGRALVPTITRAERGSEITLVLVRASDGAELALAARVVVALEEGAMQGTVLELALELDDTRARLERFVHTPEGTSDAPAELDLDALPSLDDDLSWPSDEADADAPSSEGASDVALDPKIARIRRLSAGERMKLARDGQLEDRTMLERVYGKLVWPELLRNPGITPPEVARIAQKGTLPRILLEQIVDNQAMSRQTIVRRALLMNPRIGPDAVAKLLRLTPKAELKTMLMGTAYPIAVRTLAKRLLDD